jgi:6-pyruvoyltetrahydropterin/6-carboxytetrahydropterin synthase
MFTITVENTFAAQHQLTMHDGRTEPLHSHDWIVTTAVSATKLDKTGLTLDFNQIKEKVEKIIAPLSKAKLEELTCFQGINTSAENLAKYIFTKVEPLLPANVKLKYVEVCEAPGCRAKFSK